MNLIKKAPYAITSKTEWATPNGTVKVVDSIPLNWLDITDNTVEELVRVSPAVLVEPAAMDSIRWGDDQTFDLDIRQDERFHEGEPVPRRRSSVSSTTRLSWPAPRSTSTTGRGADKETGGELRRTFGDRRSPVCVQAVAS